MPEISLAIAPARLNNNFKASTILDKGLKKIVIINQDSGYLVIDIANDLAGRNLDVSLIAGRVVARNNALSDSISHRRIIKYNRTSTLRRLFSWTIGFLQILFIVKIKHRRDYLLIFSNPPFTSFLPLFCNNRFSLMIFDVYPDALVNMGIVSGNSALARFWKKKNRKVFARAENIFTLTEGMSALLSEYCGAEKLKVVPLWGDSSFFKPVPKDTNPFIADHNLRGRFVVMYSGNLGATHNVEIFPELALRIRDPKIVLLIIGEGDRKKSLEEKVRSMNLKNIILLPLQPVNMIPFSFSAADIAMVSLSANASGLSLPSKTFSFMSAGLPLLCIAGEDSELKKMVDKYNVGGCFTPEKTDEIAKFIERISGDRDLLSTCKANSLSASEDFTSRNAGLIGDALTNPK